MSLLVLLLALNDPATAGVDVTTVRLISEASSAQSNIPITFGQAFKQGEVQGSASLGARLANGTDLPIQVDKKTRHADGSLRHAVLTLRVPSLAAGQNAEVILSAEPSGSAGSPVALAELLATNFDAEVSLNVSGTTYTASARQLLQNGSPRQWLQGELVSEWIVGGPVSANGSQHPHLAAYFHVRAYKGMDAVRVDVVVENNWSHEPAPNNFSYSYAVRIGGSTVDSGGLEHANHARWHKIFWWGRRPSIYVAHDHLYLQDTRALPNYRRVSPSESTLNGLVASVEPMGNGSLRTDFSGTGYHPQIGLLPKWAALYVVSGDRRAYRSTLANGDAGGSYSIHYRDKVTGLPVSLDDHPRAWAYSGHSDVLPDGGSDRYKHDIAHQPSIAYLPYILTGDYFYLEELQFWANYNMLWHNPDYRGNEKGLFGIQIRGQAWALRTLGHAAYATPSDHPLKEYFERRVKFNVDQYIDASQGIGHLFGIATVGYGLTYEVDGDAAVGHAPWQDDFFTASVGRLVELGFVDAQPLLAFKAKYPIGRMTNSGFCYIVAVDYTRRFRGSKESPIYGSWAELFQKNYPELVGVPCGSEEMASRLGLQRGEMTGRSYSTTSYVANFYPALAMAVDSGHPDGPAAWALLEGRANQSTQAQWGDEPEWAIVPRSTRQDATVVNLSANPEVVTAGDSTTLSWSTNAQGCTASGGWSGDRAGSGTQNVGPIQQTSTFTLTCSGPGGSASRSVTVGIAAGGGTTPPPPGTPPPQNSGGGASDFWLLLILVGRLVGVSVPRRRRRVG